MRSTYRLRIVALAFAALSLVSGLAVAQQAYPVKMIRFIVPFPPGGSLDPVARLVGQKLAESWGQTVIVDNRPGGNTVIGSEALVKSSPDGHTILLVGGSTHLINSLLISHLPYDSIKDFAPIATLVRSEYLLALHPSVPANNLQEFIALAKSQPGKLNYSSSGSGNLNHLAGEFFNMMAGVKLQHIPYKGGGPALIDLLSGQVQLQFNVPIGLAQHIRSGKLKAIAITGDSRAAILPLVPTFTEAGLPDFDLKSWQGVFAPAGTPKAVVDKLSSEMGRILTMPDVREKLASQGMEPYFSTPEQFATLMNAELAKFAKIIKAAGIKFEN
ncbi:MAG: tripartite tricarboxylate transporter substrate binding protein [Pseudomonadota bacterium]